MFRMLGLVALVSLAIAAPARAQEMWSHQASGISVARTIGDMRLNQEQDASGGGGFDVILQFGTGPTAVTLYVYRSAYPNPALWFERTRIAMSANVGAPEAGVSPRSFTLGSAPAPNGLREDIAIANGRFRATSVAIAQVGEWIVKARISSQSLDRNAVAERMDRLLAALRFERMPAPHPLRLPQPCGDSNRMSGERVARVDEEAVAAALPAVMMGEAASRGNGGLAADPSAWCRDSTGVPLQYGTVYRARDGSGWVTLLADSGRAVTALRTDLPDLPRTGRAALLVNTPAATSLVALFGGLPHPDRGTPAAIPVAVGEAQGMISVGFSPPGAERGKN